MKARKRKVRTITDFEKDRFGHNDPSGAVPHWSRIVHLAHASGYVMARRPGCLPFVLSEKVWDTFPYWDRQAEFSGYYLTERSR